jgi:hypothetical protein
MFPASYFPHSYFSGAFYPPLSLLVAASVLLQARSQVGRCAATRANYFNPWNLLLISSVDRTDFVQYGTLQVRQRINDDPDTAFFVISPNSTFIPSVGEPVIVGCGTSENREFGGQVIDVRHRKVKTLNGLITFYDVECIDYGRLFDRRTVTNVWLTTSATTIATEIVTNYTDGFTSVRIMGGLPVIDYFPATNAKPSELLRRLANEIGGGFYVDPHRDVHLFDSGGEYGMSSPQTLSNTGVLLQAFRNSSSGSQLRTRVIVEGRGSQTRAALDGTETVIPVDDADLFSADGGEAIIEQQLIEYDGIVSGGPGSLVGPGVSPTTAIAVTPAAGTGIESGFHIWAYTWVTGAGETLPSPYISTVLGTLAAPSNTPARALATGGELGTGTYLYAVTFVVGAGETTPGPTGSITTNAGISPPGSSASIANDTFFTYTGTEFSPGDSIWFRITFVDGAGRETDGTDTNTITAGTIGPNTAGIVFSNLPESSDPQVTLRRFYLNVNGTFVSYITLPEFQSSMVWVDDSASPGTFKVGPDPAQERVQLSSIPIGAAGTTARKIYRTTVGGSTLKLLATIADNTTTTYLDSVADGSLGADVPSTNTTQMNQGSLTGISVGPTGVTSRKVYRSAAGVAQLQLLATIADNTTTIYTDSTADASLGANVPTSDTSGLTQEQGQVNAGSTTLIVAGPGAFSTTGGWALVANQVIRYTGISGQTLTGTGALTATVNYGATVSEAPRLTGVTGLTRSAASGAEVRLRVTRDDTSAQAVLAAIEGGDGIHVHTILDNRLSPEGATARADAELTLFSGLLTRAEWVTTDLNAKPGRLQPISLSGTDSLSTSLVITEVDVEFDILTEHPTRRCRAETVKTSGFMDVLVTEKD